MHHRDLSDEQLVSQLASLCLEGRRLVARLIGYLMEVEDRDLDKKSACSSMWDFCVRRMGMSEGETSRRLNAVRLVRRFPSLLGRIERGEVHLSALKLLAKHLDEANLDELLDATVGKTKLEIQELLARRYPRPDVPSLVMEVPAPPLACATSLRSEARASPPLLHSKPAIVEPLSESRYMVQMTMSKAGYDDLQRAKDLLRHRLPSGETAAVVERALRLLVEKLEKERLGKTARPQRKRKRKLGASKPGYIPRAVRREVFERDGEQCNYVDTTGQRCASRTLLELDHAEPRARGGADDAANVRVRCRAHNRHHAEQVFGKSYVAERIHLRQQQGQAHRIAAAAAEIAMDANPQRQGQAHRVAAAAAEIAMDAKPYAKGVEPAGLSCPSMSTMPLDTCAKGVEPAGVSCPSTSTMPLDTCAKDVEPAGLSSTSSSTTPLDTLDAATRGLVNMGFTKAEVRRALDAIAHRHRGERVLNIELLIRESLAALT